jgi:hypothetical protein
MLRCQTSHRASESVLLYTYNRVDNAPPVEKLYRPSFLASRDSTPIEPIATEIRAIA